MTTTTPRTIADLRLAHLLDDLQQAQPLSNPDLCEQRHFLDADPDTCVPLPGIAHPKTGDAK